MMRIVLHTCLAVSLSMPTFGAYGYAAPIEIKELIAASDVVVLAKVSKVRSVRGLHAAEKIASAEVLATWKGAVDGGTIEYIASSGGWFLCDITSARVGETVVLFLAKDPDGRLRIGHYGRGRMLVTGDETDRRVQAYEVIFPWITDSDGRRRLHAVIDLKTLERVVQGHRTTAR